MNKEKSNKIERTRVEDDFYVWPSPMTDLNPIPSGGG